MLSPGDETELAEAVSRAAAEGTPLEILGGGTRAGLGRPVQAETRLSTAGLAGIRLYEPGALTLVVGAGTPMAGIEETLAAENQMLAFEPPDHRALFASTGAPSIGGAVAVGASGPRRIQKGACRDFMLGVRLVDGQGRLIRNGGRVMKNVTGYDLVKPMAGSHGTLGVLTEIAFKVLPAPEATVVLRLPGLALEAAVAAMSAALGSPFDVSGAAHLPAPPGGTAETLLRLEGLGGSVAHRTGELSRHLARFAEPEIETDPVRAAAIWRAIRDVERFRAAPGADPDPVWRVSLRPSDAPGLIAALAATGPAPDHLLDWGGGLVWLSAAQDVRAAWAASAPPEEAALGVGEAGLRAIHRALRAAIGRLGGHVTLVRAAPSTRAALDVFQPEPAPLAALSAGLRAKFDPAGVLNPGRIG